MRACLKKRSLDFVGYLNKPLNEKDKELLERINEINDNLTPFQGQKEFKKHFKKEFRNKLEYNKKLFSLNPARHYYWPGYETRKKEIENSKKDGIPIRQCLAPSSNYKREEKMIEDMDDLSWKAFSLEVPLRMDARHKAEIAQKDAEIAQLRAQNQRLANPVVKMESIESSIQSRISLEEASDSSGEWELSDDTIAAQSLLIN